MSSARVVFNPQKVTSDISHLQQVVGVNGNSGLLYDVSNLSGQVQANVTDISRIDISLGSHYHLITKNIEDISNFNADISRIDISLGSHYHLITQNIEDISNLNADISRIDISLGSHYDLITQNIEDISNLNADISRIDISLGSHYDLITQNIEDISNLTADISRIDVSLADISNGPIGYQGNNALGLLQGTTSKTYVDKEILPLKKHVAFNFTIPPVNDSSFVPLTLTDAVPLAVRDNELKTVNKLVSVYSTGVDSSWNINAITTTDDDGIVKNTNNRLVYTDTFDLQSQSNLMSVKSEKSFDLEFSFKLTSNTLPAALFMWDIDASGTGYEYNYLDFSNNSLIKKTHTESAETDVSSDLSAGVYYNVRIVKNREKLFIKNVKTGDETAVDTSDNYTSFDVSENMNFGFLANDNITLQNIKMNELQYNINDGNTASILFNYRIASNPDSDRIFVTLGDSSIEVFDLSNAIPISVFRIQEQTDTGYSITLSQDSRYFATNYKKTAYLIYDVDNSVNGLPNFLNVNNMPLITSDAEIFALQSDISGGITTITLLENSDNSKQIYKRSWTQGSSTSWNLTTYDNKEFTGIKPFRNSQEYFIATNGKEGYIVDSSFNKVGIIKLASPYYFIDAIPDTYSDWRAEVISAEISGNTISAMFGTASYNINVAFSRPEYDSTIVSSQYSSIYYTNITDLSSSNPPTITTVYSVDENSEGRMKNYYEGADTMNLSQNIVVNPSRLDRGFNRYYVYEANTTNKTLTSKCTVDFKANLNIMNINKNFVISNNGNDKIDTVETNIMSIDSLLSETKKLFTTTTENYDTRVRISTLAALNFGPLFSNTILVDTSATIIDGSNSFNITTINAIKLTFNGETLTYNSSTSTYNNSGGSQVLKNINTILKTVIYNSKTYYYGTVSDSEISAWNNNNFVWGPSGSGTLGDPVPLSSFISLNTSGNYNTLTNYKVWIVTPKLL